MATSLAALSDELTKIAAEAASSKKPHWTKDVGKALLGVGIGAGLGTGAAMLTEKALPQVFQQRHPRLVPAMKIVLPILGMATSYGGQKLREHLEHEYQKAPGYHEDK